MDTIDINTKNLIPIHNNLDEDEIEFSQKYTQKLSSRITNELSDKSTIILHTYSFQNFVVDVLRDYEDYLTDKHLVDEPIISMESDPDLS